MMKIMNHCSLACGSLHAGKTMNISTDVVVKLLCVKNCKHGDGPKLLSYVWRS